MLKYKSDLKNDKDNVEGTIKKYLPYTNKIKKLF